MIALKLHLHTRVFGVDGISGDVIDGDVDVIGAVEPSSPEPIEVNARSILHCAEEIVGCRPPEFPAAGIFLEGKVEQIVPQDGFPQNSQCRGGLGVGVRTAVG